MHQSTKGLAPVTSRNEALLTERRTGFEPATPAWAPYAAGAAFHWLLREWAPAVLAR